MYSSSNHIILHGLQQQLICSGMTRIRDSLAGYAKISMLSVSVDQWSSIDVNNFNNIEAGKYIYNSLLRRIILRKTPLTENVKSM